MGEPWEAVSVAARGERRDYALDPTPLSLDGGQAEVLSGSHKPSGVKIAFKRPKDPSPDALARMRREIEIGRRLSREHHVMPVLDASNASEWFVMPLAAGSALTHLSWLRREEDRVRQLVDAVLSGLQPAHRSGVVHRDIKPHNVLWLGEGRSQRWVVADWGLGRGPRGTTTAPGRTRVGVRFGTEGFGAPELAQDAHEATPAADIFSVGQMIGWALTGQMPQANVPLLPVGGPWRTLVRAATRLDPRTRVGSTSEFRALMTQHLDAPPEDPIAQAETWAEASAHGDVDAAIALLELAANDVDDFEVHVDLLPQAVRHVVHSASKARPDLALSAARALGEHLGGDWGHRPFKWADRVIYLLLWFTQVAVEIGDDELLEEASDSLFGWDDRWNQFGPQPAIRDLLQVLRDDDARIVAAALQRHPESCRHFSELGDDRRVDRRIRVAVS